ncbi:VOC family protein [Candidatus Uhrbacteria bacterium]|nr:VOC family protein [Candidatus Uhrbacteria bacterium]
MKFNTYLNFFAKTEEAFNFYKSVLGGEFSSFVRFKDFPIPGVTIPEAEQNLIMHIALSVGDNMLMGTDALASMGHTLTVGNNVNISIHPDSKEEADRLFAGLSVGGKVEMPIADQVWGDYYGAFEDKYGIRWMINYHDPNKK